jgi:hypothetical protein
MKKTNYPTEKLDKRYKQFTQGEIQLTNKQKIFSALFFLVVLGVEFTPFIYFF